MRYNYGFFYIYIQLFVVSINFVLIIYELGRAIKKSYDKRQWLKKWNDHFKGVYVENYSKQHKSHVVAPLN